MAEADTTAFVITDDQVDFFNVFGYLKIPGLFKTEIAELTQHFDAQFRENASQAINFIHDTHYNRKRKILFGMPDRDPVLFGLLADPRIQTIGNRLLGKDFIYLPSEGNVFEGDTVWHTDEYNQYAQIPHTQTFLKTALYLDPMTEKNGAFRVIPGSHHKKSRYTQLLREHLNDKATLFGMRAEEIPAVLITSEPGDALIFNHRIQHATCGTTYARRMLYYGLSQPFQPEDIHHAETSVAATLKSVGKIYAEPLSSTENPLIINCISQLKTIEQRQRERSQNDGNSEKH